MAITTAMTAPVAMRATAAQRPSRGAISIASNSSSGRRVLSGSAIAVMMHFDGGGEPYVHGEWRRVVEAHPDGKSLRNHHPVEVSAHDRKSGTALIGGLHAGAQAFH